MYFNISSNGINFSTNSQHTEFTLSSIYPENEFAVYSCSYTVMFFVIACLSVR